MPSAGIMASAVNIAVGPPLTGMQLWLAADDASTFTFSSGTVVSQWADKSGNARHFTQATTANQPNRNGTQNGKTTVVFNGTSHWLNRASWAMTKPVTVLAVLRNTAASGQRDAVTTYLDGRIFRTSGGTVDIYQGAFLSTGASWGTTAFHQITAVFNDSSSTVARNGGSDTTGSAGTTPFGAGGTTAVGAYWNGSELWQGDIAEIVTYDRALTTPERLQVESYLKTKWGTP